MAAVHSDPRTHESRRDLLPEIQKYRQKHLKKMFVDEIKQLEISQVISKQVVNQKVALINEHKDILMAYDGKEQMEDILGIKLKL